MLLTSLQFMQGGDAPSVSAPEGAPLLDGGTHFQAVLQEVQQQLDGSAATAPPSDSSGTPYPSLAELIAEFLAESDIPTSPEITSDTREEAQNPEVDIPILPQSGHPPDVGPEPTGKNSTAQTVGPVEEAPPPIEEQLPPEHPAPVQTEHSVANAQPRSVQEHPATPAPEPERPSPFPSGQPSPPPIQETDWTPSNEPWTTLETHHPAPGWTASDNQPVSPDPSDRTPQPMPHRQIVQPEVGSGVPAPTIPTPKPDLQPEGDLPATDKDVSAAPSPPAFETQAAQAVPPPVRSDNPQTEEQPVTRPDRLADSMPKPEPLERSVLPSQAEPGPESPRPDVIEQGDWPTASEQSVRTPVLETPRQIPIPSAGTQTTPEPVVSDQQHQNTPVWPSTQPQIQPGSPAASSTEPPPTSPEQPVWTGQEHRPVQPTVVSWTSVQENETPEIRSPSANDQTPVSENPIQLPQTRPETPRIPVIGATDSQPPVSEPGPEITPGRAATPGIQHPPEYTPVPTQPAPNPTFIDPQPVSIPLPVTQKGGIPVAQQAEHQSPVVNTPAVTPTPQPVGNPQVNTPPVAQTESGPAMVRQPEIQPPVRNTGQTEVPQGFQTVPTPPEIQTSETPPSEPLGIGPQQVSNSPGGRSNTPVETIVSQNEPVVQVEIPETPPARIEGEPPVRIDITTGPSRAVSTPQGIEPGRVDMMDSVENLEETYRVTDQIVRSARLLSRNNTSQVTMRLDPPELGEVTVRLSSTGQAISGEIEVENQQVRDIVTRNMGSLREAFAREGIQIDQIEVSVNSRGGTDTPRDFSRPSSEDRENNPSPEDRQNQNRPSPEWEGSSPQQDLPQQDGGVDFLA